MNAWSILKRAKYMGAREFREGLGDVLDHNKGVVVVEKQNQPVQTLIPYSVFLNLLEASEQAREKDPTQNWFWSPSWQKRMDRTRRDVKRGRVKRFTSTKDFLSDLRK